MPSLHEILMQGHVRPVLGQQLGRPATGDDKVVHKPAGGTPADAPGAIVYGFGGGQVTEDGVRLETIGTIEVPKDVRPTVKQQDVWNVAGVDYDTREISDGQIGYWRIVVGRVDTQEMSLGIRGGR